MNGIEEINDYLGDVGFIDVGHTAHSYYSGNPEAVSFIAFLDELGIRWVSGKTAKDHCSFVKKHFNRSEDRQIIIVKNRQAKSVGVMFQFKTKQQQQTHYFNPETKELLKLI